jgi:hypothetical protein
VPVARRGRLCLPLGDTAAGTAGDGSVEPALSARLGVRDRQKVTKKRVRGNVGFEEAPIALALRPVGIDPLVDLALLRYAVQRGDAVSERGSGG